MDPRADEPHATIRMVLGFLLAGLALVIVLALASWQPQQLGGIGSTPANFCGSVGARLGHWFIGSWGIAAFLIPLLLLMYAVPLLRGLQSSHPWLRLTGTLLLLPVVAGLVHLLPLAWSEPLLQRWDHMHLAGPGGRTGFLLAGPSLGADHHGGLLTRNLAAGGSALVLLAALGACLALLQLGIARRVKGIVDNVQERSQTRGPTTARKPEATAAGTDRGPTLSAESAIASLVEQTPSPRSPTRGGTATPRGGVEIDLQRRAAERSETTSQIQAVRERIERDSTTSLDANDLVARIRARREALERGDEAASKDTRRAPAARQAEPEPEPAATEPEPAAAPNEATSRHATEAPADPDRRSTANIPPVRATPVIATGLGSSKPAPKRKPKPKPVSNGEYDLPPVDLLEDAPEHNENLHKAETLETSGLIEELFKEFKINVQVVAATRGPTITMYELELLDAGMRVNKVTGFEKDLALKLGTEGIRIVAPLPNKKTIGIEVPNKHKVPVVMRELVDECDPHKMALPVIIGRDVIGQPMVGDLAKMPHLLIAGATGTGKSVCLNAIINSILLFKSPEECKFIMVDPKMVELAGYDGIPHLLTPPITDMTKAHAALEWLCKTMDERFFALRMTGCRDIHAFNKLGADEVEKRLRRKGKAPDELSLPETMPFVVAVVDEYADLMMVNKEVEKSLVRLTAKARACGIHVILATQRPSADVVTGLIKSNLPARICCRVADKNNSRVVLDAGGAENLLGRGDMLYLMPGSSNLVRGQGVWVQDHEIDAVIDHARAQGEPEYDESITSASALMSVTGGGDAVGESDAWLSDLNFHAAVWSMYKYHRTGADFLRRKMQIGYNKATKYVEWLEDLGFLSQAKGSKPRDFLKSWDDWLDELRANGLEVNYEEEIYTNPFA